MESLEGTSLGGTSLGDASQGAPFARVAEMGPCESCGYYEAVYGSAAIASLIVTIAAPYFKFDRKVPAAIFIVSLAWWVAVVADKRELNFGEVLANFRN